MAKRKKYSKSFNRNELYAFLHALYRFIEDHEGRIFLKKIGKGVYGYYYREEEIIELDYRRDIIPTIIHEFLHHQHDDWCETKVVQKEHKIINMISASQARNIMKRLAKSIHIRIDHND